MDVYKADVWCSVNDAELQEIRQCLRDVVDRLGPNACDRRVEILEASFGAQGGENGSFCGVTWSG